MGTEEYEVLLWVLGDQPTLVNIAGFAIVAALSVVTLTTHACSRLFRYLDYKWDAKFWMETLDQ